MKSTSCPKIARSQALTWISQFRTAHFTREWEKKKTFVGIEGYRLTLIETQLVLVDLQYIDTSMWPNTADTWTIQHLTTSYYYYLDQFPNIGLLHRRRRPPSITQPPSPPFETGVLFKSLKSNASRSCNRNWVLETRRKKYRVTQRL